jgi:hypothetical protein
VTHLSHRLGGIGALAVPVAVCAAALLGLVALPASLPPEVLRGALVLLQRPVLDVVLVVAVASAAVAGPAVARWLRAEAGVGGTHIAVLAALALCVTVTVPPRTNRIYYDEQIYQSIAQNLSDMGRAQMCNDGTVEYGRLQCWRGEYNKQPYGYPHVLSVFYRAFGARERIAHDWNLAANTLLAVAVFLIAAAAWRDAWAGLFAGAIVAALPQQLLWSRTAASEPSAALFAALAVFAWIAFGRLRSATVLTCAVAATAWGLQFRPESVLLVPVLGVLVLASFPDELRRPRFWWALLLGIVLCGALTGHLVAVRNESWGTTGDRLSIQYVASNLRVNGWFYLWDERFPWFVTFLAVLGLAVSGRSWRAALSQAAWFAAFFVVYLLFYAGSYNYGADVRYSLLTYPPIAVLAGRGAVGCAALLHRLVPRSPRVAAVAVGGLLAFLWLNYLPLARAVGEEAWAAREDVAFAREFAGRLPRNSVVLTHNPNMFLLWGTSAAQASIATSEPDYVRAVYLPRYRGGVYFHWNFWCNVNDPVQQQFCVNVVDRFDTETIETRTVRDQRFVLYRLEGMR